MADPGAEQASRRARLIGIALVILAVAAGALVVFYGTDGPNEQPAAPPPRSAADAPGSPGSVVDVQVTKPTRRDVFYSIALPANVAPLYQTTLYAKVSGYLKWIGPDKGDVVKKGQVLAVIDAPEVEEQYQQAIADYNIKKLTYERMASVWKETPDVIAKQDVDMAEAAFVGAKHLMEQREVLRNYTKVTAPYSGVVTARFADPGALIQVATSAATTAIPLFTIMDIETIRVYASVPQEDTPWVKRGIPAVLTVKEFSGRSFTGAVTRTSGALDPSTRSLLVEVDLPNPDHALQPGIFGELTLELRRSPNALVIPASALITQDSVRFVFLADQGTAVRRPIKTGLSDGRWIEIVEGLAGGEDVVVVGKSRLIEGVAVRASPYSLPEGTASSQTFTSTRPNK